jgi:hypothetical protein
MSPTRYRLAMRPAARVWRVVLYSVLGALFIPGLVDPAVTALFRLGAVLGIALAVAGLRIVLGPAVVVRDAGLRVFTWWPRHRDLAWYRVFAVDVVPGAWQLELELNSGERVLLPAVERVDELYERIEELRQHLDA